MRSTIQLHVRKDSAISSGTTGAECVATLTIQDENGQTEAVLFFHDEQALERVGELLDELRHEKPFHLAFRSGCPACERMAQRTANRLVRQEAAPAKGRR